MAHTKADTKSLTEGALLSKIILFSLPLMATGILQLLFNTADTVVVGRWGGETEELREIALAAVGSCGSLIHLIVNVFMGLSVGASVCVSRDLGAKRHGDVQRTVHTAVSTALICGISVAILGFFLARPLLILMGTDASVLDQAVPYMQAYFLGAPANMVYNYCASILRSKGDTVRPLLFLSAGGVVNVGLNLIMVLAFGMGAVGVGIATAASHWVACILVLIFMTRMEGPCRLDLKKLCLDREKLKRIFAIGIPAGLQGMVFSFSNVLIQSSINSFGKTTVAANAAGSNICDYIYMAQNALHYAAVTFVGQNLGAHRLDRIRKSVLYCCGVATAVGVLLGIAVMLLGESLLGIFAPGNAEVIDIGMVRIRILCSTYFLCGVMDVGSATLRAFGRSLTSTLVSVVGCCMLRIIWIYTVFASVGTLQSLYLSYPVTWAVTTAAQFLFVFLSYRKLRQVFSTELQAQPLVAEPSAK